MKKILMSLAILTGACSLIFATTRAVWTDSVSIEGNKIETGNVDIQVTTKENPSETDWNSLSQGSNLVLSGLLPGEGEKSGYAFSLRNNSNSEITFNLSDKISNLELTNGNTDNSKLLIRVFNYENDNEGSNWMSLDEWLNNGETSLNVQLPKNIVKKFGIEAKLDSEAGNDWQNQNVSFDMEITGTQI